MEQDIFELWNSDVQRDICICSFSWHHFHVFMAIFWIDNWCDMNLFFWIGVLMYDLFSQKQLMKSLLLHKVMM
jgi:hypothetical protein